MGEGRVRGVRIGSDEKTWERRLGVYAELTIAQCPGFGDARCLSDAQLQELDAVSTRSCTMGGIVS